MTDPEASKTGSDMLPEERVADLPVPTGIKTSLARFVRTLRAQLPENLHACVIYGSAVRGGFVPDISDVNLLIVLEASSPEAHAVIGEAVRREGRIAPFVIERGQLRRTARAFAPKFQSIQRSYLVIEGPDPLAGLVFDAEVFRFLAEQELRNARLRLTRAFILWGDDPKRYTRYLVESTAMVLSAASDAVRCAGILVPHGVVERLSVVERTLGADVGVLVALLDLRRAPPSLAPTDLTQFHGQLLALIDRAIQWMEGRWPESLSIRT
jgi:hypothetical protein